MTDSPLDIAVIAWREEGSWNLLRLANSATSDIGLALDELRNRQGDGGALVALTVDDEFFILIRQTGERMQMAISNVLVALDYEIAAEVLELLDIEAPHADDAPEPAGDLNLLADFGIDALELQFICDNEDLYPDEQLEEIARRIGFLDQFLEIVSES